MMSYTSYAILDLFRLCPPHSLVDVYYLQPADARAIFCHNYLPCNDTCSVTGGGGGAKQTKGEAQTEKIRYFFLCSVYDYYSRSPVSVPDIIWSLYNN